MRSFLPPVRRPRALHARLGSLVLVSFPLLAAPGRLEAAGGDLRWIFYGIEDIVCADEIEDQNTDGFPDIVLESYDAGAVGDHLYCLSGWTPSTAAVTIWSAHPPGGLSSGGGYGDECLRTSADLSGDGLQDVLLGTAWGGRTAYGIDGTDGSVIWDFDTYADSPPSPPVSGWVYTICSIPDADGDTFPDVFFGCGSYNDRIYHVSGHDGAVIWSLGLGDAVFATAPLNDVSGDGKDDVVAGVGDYGDAVWCLRGGAAFTPTIWTHPMPGSVLAVARIADLNSDGTNDVLAGTWDSSVFAFDGASGDTLWIWSSGGFAYVMRIAVLDDVNGDGKQDAAIGSWDARAFVLSGADGSEIWSYPTGDDVWAIGRVDDVTGDGINDVVAGSFDHWVYVLDGTNGALQWSYNTGNRIYFVMGTSDLSGNTVPDVFAGTQKLTGSPGGRAYLLEGGDNPPTAAELPVLVEASPLEEGVEVRLSNAYGQERCYLERHEGVPNRAAAARAFREEIALAYRNGELTVPQAIQARSQGPEILWSRISAEEIPVLGGRAVQLDRSAQPGHTYTYRFAFLSEGRLVGYSPTATVVAGGHEDVALPQIRTSPNPLRSGTVRIEFRLPGLGPFRLDAYDTSGRKVATLQSEQSPGSRDVSLEWEPRSAQGHMLPGGVYFLRLQGEGFATATKLTLLH